MQCIKKCHHCVMNHCCSHTKEECTYREERYPYEDAYRCKTCEREFYRPSTISLSEAICDDCLIKKEREKIEKKSQKKA